MNEYLMRALYQSYVLINTVDSGTSPLYLIIRWAGLGSVQVK